MFLTGSAKHHILSAALGLLALVGSNWELHAKSAISYEPAIDPMRPPIEKLVARTTTIDDFVEQINGFLPSEWADSDGDGVIDIHDACRTTEIEDRVDSCGCSLLPELERFCPDFYSWCTANKLLRYDAIYFDFDSDKMKASEIIKLQRFAADLIRDRQANVVLTGHADRYGKDEYNLRLSKRRVTAISKMLNSLGISSNRMSVSWAGEFQRIWEGRVDDARARNRRVELFIDWLPLKAAAPASTTSGCIAACDIILNRRMIVPVNAVSTTARRSTETEKGFLLNDDALPAIIQATGAVQSNSDRDVLVNNNENLNLPEPMRERIAKELISSGVDPLSLHVTEEEDSNGELVTEIIPFSRTQRPH